ncbi:tyrosinase [Bradyrhizobium japonicum]|uniref:tyrosinase family protein n=1 Tax=Bradyrhizobium liaoningense TaxID=43992 RepID=UPI001BADE67C|nr:tyrosinase family protein [Bradyrhizobium liaoningense]MBR1070594.1 tyrosinase family protein [Bradyrhizobium liaoningense]
MIRAARPSLTRRDLLAAGAALAASQAFPSVASAQTPKFRRWEITDPAMPSRVLASYKAGITKMLALPPTDPRNWYRNAIVHLFDCPHGNWWFLGWHRAYLGWLEVTLRDLSSDPEFALPYWDWTKTPRVPVAMFDDVLDPNNGAFIPSFQKFKAAFEPAITALYASFSPTQRELLALRPFPFTTPADFWQVLPQVFFDQPGARGLTATNPDLDSNTRLSVQMNTIRSALRTSQFAGSGATGAPAGFQSAKAADHSGGSIKGILESGPHDNVHGAMGGGGDAFMISFFSPVDPIFFLHHGNLDRLWTVWTRRQTALGRPILPQGADLTAWSDEKFLFFSNAKGEPVSQTKAGDYAATSLFDYDYSPGSGDDQVPAPGPVAEASPQVFSAQVTSAAVGAGTAAGGIADVPVAALASSASADASRVVEITLNLSHDDAGRRFRVLVSAGPGSAPVAAGAITVFGHPHHGPATFTVPLPDSLGSAATGATVPLDVRVVPIGTPPRPAAAPTAAAAPAPLVSAIRIRTD